MSTIKKLMMTAAGGAEALAIEDVFSTYLYTGNGGTQTITNGIPLSNLGFGTSTEFDGVNDYLYKTSDLTGNTNSSTFTFSAWVYHTGTVGMLLYASSTGGKIEWILNDPTNGGLNLVMESPNGTARFNLQLNNAVYPRQLYHILVSANMANASQRHVYINDAPWTNLTWSSYVNTAIDFTHTNWWIGSNQGSSQYWPGRMSHFYLDYTYRDLTIEANRRLFIDANGGSTPPSTLSALSPKIYLPMTGDYSIGQNLGTGGNFTANDSPTIVQTGTEYIEGSTEGGLVWTKGRSLSTNHILVDTERGAGKSLSLPFTSGEVSDTTVTSFTSSGFTLGNNGNSNSNTHSFASWSFRKAPRFFDIQTWVGDSVSGRAIPHNLGITPGCIIVKVYDGAGGDWTVYHRSNTADPETDYLTLNTANATLDNNRMWNDTAPTDQVFYVGDSGNTNNSGWKYVAYLFAHDPLGPSGDGSDGLIACGSFIGNTGTEVNLGWEPQWLLVKDNTDTGYWTIVDTMRGWTPSVDNNNLLYPNRTDAESQLNAYIDLTSTGFKARALAAGRNYIYVAIRRGPMRQPESGTEVFAIDTTATAASGSTPSYVSNFPVDMGLYRRRSTTAFWALGTRLLQGTGLNPASTAAEYIDGEEQFDYMIGWKEQASAISDQAGWMFRRAPGFFDVVAYTGNGVAGRTVSHNLGVAPELMLVKARSNARNWGVMPIDATKYMYLNQNIGALSTNSQLLWFNTQPSDSIFTLGTDLTVNGSGWTYIAYLFATLPGVSKVGSYTGNGSSQTINCGFTSGARFVLIKRTDSTGDWYVWDTARGIVTGNDPHLSLNTTAAEVTTDDSVDPASTGFIVNQVAATNINVNGGQYIFLAIA